MTSRFDYEEILLRALPQPCQRALDVGCGHGAFARRLAERVDEVDALDRVDLAVTGPPNLRFKHADFMHYPIEPQAYDAVFAIASLHHLPLASAIERMKSALRPGGLLGVIGLFRDAGLVDFLWSTVAFPVSRYRRRGRAAQTRDRHPSGGTALPSRAPIREPGTTLEVIRNEISHRLPGARFERRLLWRYTLLWIKP